MAGLHLMVLVLFPAALVCVGALLRKDIVVPSESKRLTLVAQTSLRWNWIGIGGGLIVAIISMQIGQLGRGVMLAAPLFSLCLLTAVVIGELKMTPPSGPTRYAALERRQLRDYIPRRLARLTACATVGLIIALVATTAMGSADDMGRSGRSLSRQCSATSSSSRGPWPGSFYSLPLAAIVLGGLMVTMFALLRIARRPRQDEGIELDDTLRRHCASAVVASFGMLVAAPFCGVSFFAAHALLLFGSCAAPLWTTFGVVALLLAPCLLVMTIWCASIVLRPIRTSGSRTVGTPASGSGA
jgi:hypothetical protein